MVLAVSPILAFSFVKHNHPLGGNVYQVQIRSKWFAVVTCFAFLADSALLVVADPGAIHDSQDELHFL
jgi:hypothetical protein